MPDAHRASCPPQPRAVVRALGSPAMPTVVVPFRGVEGKSRLARVQRQARPALAHAMLGGVGGGRAALAPTVVVAPEGRPVGAAIAVVDPGGGQGAAVSAGLD